MLIRYLGHRTAQTILAIIIFSLVAGMLPDFVHRILYSASLLIKDVLILVMPITVFAFISYTIGSFRSKAILFVVILAGFETISNFTSVWYAIGAGHMVSSKFIGFEIIKLQSDFSPIWRLSVTQPLWWGVKNGSMLGVLVGCYIAYVPSSAVRPGIDLLKYIMEFILTKIFTKLIPIYVLGFVAQIYKTGMLEHMLVHYSILILYLVLFLAFYLFMIFFVGASGRVLKGLAHMKNLFPAWILALTSGCSLSTMPWTIKDTRLNLRDPELANAIIPATTNIQQIGDCIVNTFLCFLIYTHFYGHAPDKHTLMVFSVVFVLARFATAAVIGGAIFIMLPIYQNYLDFSDEMIAIILALNVILDPIVTSSNVLANGGLTRVFENLWIKVSAIRKA